MTMLLVRPEVESLCSDCGGVFVPAPEQRFTKKCTTCTSKRCIIQESGHSSQPLQLHIRSNGDRVWICATHVIRVVAEERAAEVIVRHAPSVKKVITQRGRNRVAARSSHGPGRYSRRR